ncbi:MAG: hypothetical protein NWS71_10655, partial [Opitutales bacterium]|nr:hypothetical protein [Opitutales bacterium]
MCAVLYENGMDNEENRAGVIHTLDSDRSNSPQWTVCPVCHGEGKVTRRPTKRAQLRYKRALLGDVTWEEMERWAFYD